MCVALSVAMGHHDTFGHSNTFGHRDTFIHSDTFDIRDIFGHLNKVPTRTTTTICKLLGLYEILSRSNIFAEQGR